MLIGAVKLTAHSNFYQYEYKYQAIPCFSLTIVSQCLACQPKNQEADNTSQKTKPLNVVFILSDDHRYDYMGFMNTIPWLETPNMDRMAKEGAHIKNAGTLRPLFLLQPLAHLDRHVFT